MVLSLLVNIRFQVLFHSPPGVLFTFPSRYYSLSVTWSYLAFGDGPPFFRLDFSCPDVLRILLASFRFRLQGFHLSRLPFQVIRLSSVLLPCSPYPTCISTSGLGFSDFARHYFRNHFCFLFLRVLRCFSSPGSLPITIDSLQDNTILLVLSSLIRISTDLWIFAPSRSFSQLVTSFFGAMYQGILRMLFVAWSSLFFLLVFSTKKFYSFHSANTSFAVFLQTFKIAFRFFLLINLLALLS